MSSNRVAKMLCKSIVISVFVLYIVCILWPDFRCCDSFSVLTHLRPKVDKMGSSYSPSTSTSTATNISHIVFGMASSSNSWRNKRWYIESLWRPWYPRIRVS